MLRYARCPWCPHAHSAEPLVHSPQMGAKPSQAMCAASSPPICAMAHPQDAVKRITGDELPDFYNILLERPKDDPDGYDVLCVDAAAKVGCAGLGWELDVAERVLVVACRGWVGDTVCLLPWGWHWHVGGTDPGTDMHVPPRSPHCHPPSSHRARLRRA